MLRKAVTFKKWEVGSEQDELEDYSHLPLGESFRVTEQGGEMQSEPGAEGSKLEVRQRQDRCRSQHLRDGRDAGKELHRPAGGALTNSADCYGSAHACEKSTRDLGGKYLKD